MQCDTSVWRWFAGMVHGCLQKHNTGSWRTCPCSPGLESRSSKSCKACNECGTCSWSMWLPDWCHTSAHASLQVRTWPNNATPHSWPAFSGMSSQSCTVTLLHGSKDHSSWPGDRHTGHPSLMYLFLCQGCEHLVGVLSGALMPPGPLERCLGGMAAWTRRGPPPGTPRLAGGPR